MEYRKLPRGEEEISIIGLGTGGFSQGNEKETEATVALALENGINYFDMAAADDSPFAPLGRAIADLRHKVYLQVHFGAEYHTGKYGWALDLEIIKRSVDWQLKTLKTDYIDFGFLHCIDEMADLDQAIGGGSLEYIRQLKKEGVVRHLGLSTHTPQIARHMLKTDAADIPDMLMFSINPAYDYRHGDYAIGRTDERSALYRQCETQGVGISVMKPFGAGQLLNAATSPFGRALTEYQCLQYALDKPGVITVLPGVRDRKDLRRILGFTDAAAQERDYSILGDFTPPDVEGVCVYCNHCQPCPQGLDVGLINKYYDLAIVGDELARNHYLNLQKKAADCIACGHCDQRCPFHVKQMARMKEIDDFFAKTSE